jgi:glycosyltransferase involved in cell wall biosynthesis
VTERAPLRVLHCLWSGEVGGTERAIYQLAREQQGDPSIAPAVLFARARGPYWQQVRELGVPVVDLGLEHGRAIRELGRIERAMREFDIHHFHSAEPLLMLASTRCPTARRVYTHRGGTTRYSLRKRAQYAFVGMLLRRSFQALSGNTVHATRCAADLFKLPAARFRVTQNGLDFDLLEPKRSEEDVRAELKLPPECFVVGTAANLKRWKRIDRLIAAVGSLDGRSMHLLVVGDGEDRRRLETLAARSGVADRVTFAGMREHVADFLQVMDAFCLPSTGLESFGNAAVEAMALGLPTIVFGDGGGLVEHIDPGETGFVVSKQAELEATISRLASDPEQGRRIGARGRAFVRANYTLERAASRYRDLYAEALGEAARGQMPASQSVRAEPSGT